MSLHAVQEFSLFGKVYKRGKIDGRTVRLDATYFVYLAVLRDGLIVWLFGDILFQGQGLKDAIMPLKR